MADKTEKDKSDNRGRHENSRKHWFNSETGAIAGRKGSLKTAEKKREKRKIKEIINILLSSYSSSKNSDGELLSNKELLVLSQFRKAVKEGDITACRWLLDSSDEYESEQNESEQNSIQTIAKIHSWLSWQSYSTNICFLYGTTRSGKTYAVIQWLLLSLKMGGLADPTTGKAMILIAGQTVPFLKNGCANYILNIAPKISSEFTILNNGFIVKHPNGEIRLQSFDDYSKTLSAQWSAVFFNEGNYIASEVFDSIRIRTSGLIICDYNPSINVWWGAKLINETNGLFCTFKDNPFLSSSQLEAIESIKERGINAPYGSYENWFYNVYYLGKYAEMGGGVFMKVYQISENEFDAANCVLCHGIDFGDVTDPNALVAVKVDTQTKTIYVNCLYYETATDDIRMVEILNAYNIQRLVCETATGGQTRMQNFKRLGFQGRVIPCEKERVSQSVFNLTSFAIKCVDENSYNEFKGYKIENGKFSGADHAIDAVRYVTHLILTNKIR